MTTSRSMPAILLRLEGFTMLVGAVTLYAMRGGDGWLFALLILTPDLSALGYLAGVKTGSMTYNAVHTYVLPGALIALGLVTATPPAVRIALIWFAHIGMDRALGFGLKYPTVFQDTHLGKV